jgi:hypothetical protein
MSNVLPFGGPKDGLSVPNTGLVDATGEKVKTARSLQNEIIQRRNFVLIDCVTGESVISNGNPMQAYMAVNALLPNLVLSSVQYISSQIAGQVVAANNGGVPAEVQDEAPVEQPESTVETPVEATEPTENA